MTRSPLIVEKLTSRQELARLEREWEALLAEAETASPFLTPGWQMAWLDSYGLRHELFVLTARRNGKLVGLWPLARLRRGPFRVLEPVGAGRSDWLDVLTLPDELSGTISAFLECLYEHRSEWDLLECRDILEASPTIALLESCGRACGMHMREQLRTVAPYLRLSGSWEEFLSSKRAKFRSNLKYYRRLAERRGVFAIRRHDWRDEDGVVDELGIVERRSWKAREGNLKISTAAGREFYRRFCDYFAGRGQLDIWRAELEGELIAFLVNIAYGNKCYHYNTCFDERYADLSLGSLLHAEAISNAYDRSLSEYDFLSGEESYKDRWSSGKRQIKHIALYTSRPASYGAFTLLVHARWAFRRSEVLRKIRASMLSIGRQLTRRS